MMLNRIGEVEKLLKEENWKVVKRDDLRWMREVRVDGEVLSGEEALRRAEESALDLVLVNMHPFIGKFIDYKKTLYDAQKRAKELQKKQRENEQKLKEIKFHPSIGENDYMHKLKQIEEFINEGDRVDVKIVLRGREAYMNAGFVEAFQERLVGSLNEIGKFFKAPSRNGKIIYMSVVKK